MLSAMRDLLIRARRQGYAVPAFNFDNFDVLFGIFRGSIRTQSPIIVQITEPAVRFLGIDNVVSVVRNEAARAALATALHLDHGRDMDLIRHCIEAGFTSVMIDCSSEAVGSNVAATRSALSLARTTGATVEAALGHVGSNRDYSDGAFTDPNAAREFWTRTEVDALAVAAGTVHGGARGAVTRLDLERLGAIARAVPVPLVLHGSSGASFDDLKAAVAVGVAKMNVETELRWAFRRSLEQALREQPDEVRMRNLVGEAQTAVAAKVLERQELLGCAGKGK